MFYFICADFSYPNINTYLTSYMRQNEYNDCLSYSSFFYLVVAKMSLQSLSMPWLGGLAAKMGPRISVLGRDSFHLYLYIVKLPVIKGNQLAFLQ